LTTALKLTVHLLDALPDDNNRYELIDGELLVSRAPGITHQRVVGELYRLIKNSVDDSVGELIINPGVVFDDYNAVIPDLVFVSRDRSRVVTERGLIAAPDLVIEVLSPGEKNAERDRDLKRHLSGVRGVREYWIVDPQLMTVEIYRPQNNLLVLASTLHGSDTLSSPLLPQFSCRVAEVFTKVVVSRDSE
jgi:Uma2 family endonuclease